MQTSDKLMRHCVATAILLAAVAVADLPPAAAAGEVPAAGPEEWTTLDRRPGEGEQCLVCGRRVHGDEVVEVRYKGRTFFVSAAMFGLFEEDPEQYFCTLQARAGLFDEAGVAARPMASGWLVFGLYVLVGLIFAAGCGYLAVARAHRPLPWFFAGLLGNVAALVVLLATPRGDAAAMSPFGVPPGLAKVPTTRSPQPCPRCGGTNHPAATACSGCAAPLEPGIEPETARI